MGERRIAGRYELVEQLGTSSWRAVDTDLEREVFVRMPGRDVSAARLTHHGIVPLFDQGEEDGVPYAVYEYLAGGSLERRLAAAPLSEAEAGRVAAEVTAALTYAHEQGVTHGSIGPASVMLSADGDAKLAGFTGTGTPADDERALAALLQTLGTSAAVAAVAAGEAGVTAIMSPSRPGGRRPLVLALTALALVGAGIGAAFLAASGESKPAAATTGSGSAATSNGSTEEPVVPPPSTTAEETATGTTTTSPPPTTAPATTAPAPPTAPPATTEPAPTEPVPTTEPSPETTEPQPTTEPPPTTEATTQAATTG